MLSSARFEGVVIRMRGGMFEDEDDGRRRSWKISSMRVCVLPVCHFVVREDHIRGQSEITHAWRTMDARDLFCSETKLNCLFLTRVEVLSKPLDLPRCRSGIICQLSDRRRDLPSPRWLLDTKQGVDKRQVDGGRAWSGVARQNEST
jgi:hypothetical protein